MRSITINGEKWKYLVGKDVTVIRRPDHTIFCKYANWALVGVDSPDTFERGKYKRTSDGMVKPSHIRALIVEELKNPPRKDGHRNPLLDESINPYAGDVTLPSGRRSGGRGFVRRAGRKEK